MLKRYPRGQVLGHPIAISDTGIGITPPLLLGWALNELRDVVSPTRPRTRILDGTLNEAVQLVVQQMGSKLTKAKGLPAGKALDLSGDRPPAGKRARQVMELRTFTVALHTAGLLAPRGDVGFIMADSTRQAIRDVYRANTKPIRKAMRELDGAHEAIVGYWAEAITRVRSTLATGPKDEAIDAGQVWASVWESCYGPWSEMHGHRSDYSDQSLDDHVRMTRAANLQWLRLVRVLLDHDPATSPLLSATEEQAYLRRNQQLEPGLLEVVAATFGLAGIIGGSHRND